MLKNERMKPANFKTDKESQELIVEWETRIPFSDAIDIAEYKGLLRANLQQIVDEVKGLKTKANKVRHMINEIEAFQKEGVN